ncbi:MAG: galactose mutarotase [Acidobacteria bacterium]|nr:galactose mutarotase [Acidobacteriota bacterium]
MRHHLLLTLFAAVSLMNCGSGQDEKKAASSPMTITKEAFGATPAGESVDVYTLSNTKGMQVRISTYGAIVVSMVVPDKAGKAGDVVLGFDSLAGYQKEHPYFGAIVGRYGNRIAKGQFTLDGTVYKLAVNNGANALHGGLKGFDKVVWRAKEMSTSDGVRLDMVYTSKDGEEGYPGTLTTTVSYTLLNERNEIKIDYEAVTDKPTVVNLTNHSYFNLAGQGEGNILNHSVTIFGSRFTPVDAGLIPTGELKPVEGTPFDFRTAHAIGERIEAKDAQIVAGKGYDHNWVLDKPAGELGLAARVTEATSGRVLEVYTTEPGLQFYTGNFLDGTLTGKGGKVYGHRAAFCMETQHYPDSPNQPSFPSTRLGPAERYRTTTSYRFLTAQ